MEFSACHGIVAKLIEPFLSEGLNYLSLLMLSLQYVTFI